MPLKNYTTAIGALKSIGEIQGNLVAHGARTVMIGYGAFGNPESLSFEVFSAQGDISFRLPANVGKVQSLLEKQLYDSNYRSYDSVYQAQRKEKLRKQAPRVAWRILKDWVDAQMAIIETEMVTLEEVFLPYMQVKDGRTLYQLMQHQGFLLTESKERQDSEVIP